MADVTLKLVVLRGGPNLKADYPLTQQVITLGRSLNNLIVLQDNKVSRYHAEIVKQDADFLIRDLESANGIKVNGSRVMSKALEPGDIVIVGQTEFRVDQAVLTSAVENEEDDDEPDLALLMKKDSGDSDDPPAFLSGIDLDRDEERMGRVTGSIPLPSFESVPTRGQVPPPPMGDREILAPFPHDDDPLMSYKLPTQGLADASDPGGYTSYGDKMADHVRPGADEESGHPALPLLEQLDVTQGTEGVGGMAYLLAWLAKRSKMITAPPRSSPLPRPSAIILVGVSGTGKTLLTQYVASQWGVNFFRLALPRLLFLPPDRWNSALLEAFSQAEAYQPSLLVIENVDQISSRVEAMGDDIKKSYYVVMELLTHWVRTKGSSPFTIVTGNNPRQMHPELLRRGDSIDEVFFVDLPPTLERGEILEVQLAQLGRAPNRYDIRGLADASEGFTGRQIREAIVNAIFDTEAEGREASSQDIRLALSRVVPMFHVYGKQVEEIRQWGRLWARCATAVSPGMQQQQQPVRAPAPVNANIPRPVSLNAVGGSASAPAAPQPSLPAIAGGQEGSAK